MDIATLGYAIDVSGLKEGDAALDQSIAKNNELAASAAKTSDAIKTQGTTTTASAQQMKAAYGSSIEVVQANAAAVGGFAAQQQAATATTVELTAAQKAFLDLQMQQIGVQQLINEGYAKNSAAVAQFTALHKAGTTAETEYGRTVAANAATLAGLTSANNEVGAATKAASKEVEGFSISGQELRHGMEAVKISAEDLGVQLGALGGLAGIARGGFVLLAGAVGAGLAAALATAGDAMITAKTRLEGIAGVSLSNKLIPQLDDIAKKLGAQPAAIEPAVEAFVKLGQAVSATSSIQFKAAPGMEAFLPGIQGATQLQKVIENLGLFMRGSGVDDAAKMAAAIAAFGNAMQKTNSLTVQDFATLNDAAPKLGRALAEAFQGTSLNAVALFENRLKALPIPAQQITAAIAAMGPAAQKAFQEAEEHAKTTGSSIDALTNSAKSLWQAIAGQSGAAGAAQGLFDSIKNKIDASTQSVRDGTSAWNDLFKLFNNEPISPALANIGQSLSPVRDKFQELFTFVDDGLMKIGQGLGTLLSGGFQSNFSSALNDLSVKFDAWRNDFISKIAGIDWSNAWQGLVSGFQSALSGMASAFNGFISSLNSQISSLAQQAQSAGAGAASSANSSGVDAGIYAGSYATGGSFTVGGSGGTDSQLVSFHATPGESVNVVPQGATGSLLSDAARAVSSNATPGVTNTGIANSGINASEQFANQAAGSGTASITGPISGAVSMSADQITTAIAQLTSLVQQGQTQAQAAIATSGTSGSSGGTSSTAPVGVYGQQLQQLYNQVYSGGLGAGGSSGSSSSAGAYTTGVRGAGFAFVGGQVVPAVGPFLSGGGGGGSSSGGGGSRKKGGDITDASWGGGGYMGTDTPGAPSFTNNAAGRANPNSPGAASYYASPNKGPTASRSQTAKSLNDAANGNMGPAVRYPPEGGVNPFTGQPTVGAGIAGLAGYKANQFFGDNGSSAENAPFGFGGEAAPFGGAPDFFSEFGFGGEAAPFGGAPQDFSGGGFDYSGGDTTGFDYSGYGGGGGGGFDYSGGDTTGFDYSGYGGGGGFDYSGGDSSGLEFAGGGSFSVGTQGPQNISHGTDTVPTMLHLSPGEDVSVNPAASGGGGRSVNGGMGASGKSVVINIMAQSMAGVEQSRASLMRAARNV